MTVMRTYRAGSAIEDFCRACKADRMHVVIAADAAGAPLRVTCGFCRSEHSYRGGPRQSPSGEPSASAPVSRPPASSPARDASAAFPLVSERERRSPAIMLPEDPTTDLELLLRRIIREESGLTTAVPADKWRGGTLVLKPGTPGVQEKTWPIETLEQQVNASDLPDDVKVKLQAYVSGCYGSLTSFNVLFADEDDKFIGAGGE